MIIEQQFHENYNSSLPNYKKQQNSDLSVQYPGQQIKLDDQQLYQRYLNLQEKLSRTYNIEEKRLILKEIDFLQNSYNFDSQFLSKNPNSNMQMLNKGSSKVLRNSYEENFYNPNAHSTRNSNFIPNKHESNHIMNSDGLNVLKRKFYSILKESNVTRDIVDQGTRLMETWIRTKHDIDRVNLMSWIDKTIKDKLISKEKLNFILNDEATDCKNPNCSPR